MTTRTELADPATMPGSLFHDRVVEALATFDQLISRQGSLGQPGRHRTSAALDEEIAQVRAQAAVNWGQLAGLLRVWLGES
jgi:hypothetical protein